jgi:hypothetical protein
MDTNTRIESGAGTGAIDWQWAALAGVLGTVAFGTLQHLTGGAGTIEVAFPALYGLGPSLAVGWGIHLFHGAVLGLVYAAIVSVGPLQPYARRVSGGVVLGLLYGVVTTVALAWLLMPVWLGAVGFPSPPPFPNVSVNSLVGHALYGLGLGVLYPVLSQRV